MNKVTKVALVAAVVVTLSAIVPNANASGVAKWGGSTGTFSNSCEFKTNTVGVMALNHRSVINQRLTGRCTRTSMLRMAAGELGR